MFGDNIKRLMVENGYTQKQLAMRSQCTESAISKYIHNEREPSIRILKNLAIALGVTVDELISEKGKDTNVPPKKDFFTPEDVRNMSPKEVRKNYSAIMKSMKEW